MAVVTGALGEFRSSEQAEGAVDGLAERFRREPDPIPRLLEQHPAALDLVFQVLAPFAGCLDLLGSGKGVFALGRLRLDLAPQGFRVTVADAVADQALLHRVLDHLG